MCPFLGRFKAIPTASYGLRLNSAKLGIQDGGICVAYTIWAPMDKERSPDINPWPGMIFFKFNWYQK